MSDEDYMFGAGDAMDTGEDYFLVPGNDWQVEQTPKQQTFFGVSRGVSRLGIFFCSGLASTLLIRLIPALIPGYAILIAGSTIAAVLYLSLTRQTPQKILATFILLAVWMGIVGGSWDAIYAVFTTIEGQKRIYQFAGVAAALLLVAGIVQVLKGGQRQWND